MSLTIANLKYQETSSAIHRYIRDNYSWLMGASIIDGVSGKSTVNDITITGSLLTPADCVLDARDTALLAKEIELDYYNLSFPVSHCDLRRTWLSAFANKYINEEDVYIDSLIPYLAEKLSDEIRAKVFTDVIAEAVLDADVAKVTLTGNITTATNAYLAVLEFINGFSVDFRNRIFDKNNYVNYQVNVSSETYSLVSQHLGDKHGSYSINIGGLSIVCDNTLTGASMYCTSRKNVLVVFDSTDDLNRVKIVEKEWENTSYIVSGLAFKGSYVDSSEITITN